MKVEYTTFDAAMFGLLMAVFAVFGVMFVIVLASSYWKDRHERRAARRAVREHHQAYLARKRGATNPTEKGTTA
jgi:uncharacterized membrane protein